MDRAAVEEMVKAAKGKLASKVERGAFSVTINATAAAARASALDAFKAAHTAYAHVDKSLDDVAYEVPTVAAFDAFVVLPPKSARKTVSAGLTFLEKAGLRPLTFAELVAAGTSTPELAMQSQWLMALGSMRATQEAFPTLRHSGGHRVLIADAWDPWSDAAWLATPKA